MPTYFYFSETLGGLRPGTYFSTLEICLIFVILLFLDFREPICYDPDREDFKEPLYMRGEKMFMSLGVEDGYGFPSISEIDIYSVVSLGVPDLVALSVPAHGIPSAVYSVFPGLVSHGSTISVSN